MPDPPHYRLGCPTTHKMAWYLSQDDPQALNYLGCKTCKLNCGGPKVFDSFVPVKRPDGFYRPCNGCFACYERNREYDQCAEVCTHHHHGSGCGHPAEPCKEAHP